MRLPCGFLIVAYCEVLGVLLALWGAAAAGACAGLSVEVGVAAF